MNAAPRIAVLARLSLSGMLLLPFAAEAEVVYRERVETIEIGVRDGMPEDIWTAVRRYGPFVRGKHAAGAASGRLKWSNLSIARQGHRCRLEGQVIAMDVVMTLPEWRRANDAPDDERDYWQCIARIVTAHEKRHAEIWRETAEAADRALRRLDDWMPCDDLRSVVSETADRIYADGAHRQRVFDADDRRLQRYKVCPRPLAAQSLSGLPRSRVPESKTVAAIHNGVAVRHAKATPSSSSAFIGENDGEPETEEVREREPRGALSRLAAAILALLAAASAGLVGLRITQSRARRQAL